MAEYRFCRVEDEGRIRIVTINRPEVLNALHSEAHWEFDAVWNEFAADPELWIGIITGAGERAFSAGNDLKVQAAGPRRPRRLRPCGSSEQQGKRHRQYRLREAWIGCRQQTGTPSLGRARLLPVCYL